MAKKVIRLSNSGMNRYMGCGKSYEFHYIHKMRSNVKSSALFFGSAIDAACNFMLENFDRRKEPFFVDKALEIFQNTWSKQFDKDSGLEIDLRDNANIKYFKSDYDLELLSRDDLTELGLDTQEAVSDYEASRAELELQLKENGGKWLDIDEDLRKDYNEVNWFCLLRKGYVMIPAYFEQILPEFKRIHFLQKSIELADENGNVVNGIAEFQAELLDGRNALIDNKTSGTPYEPDSVENSQQLSLYERILNIQGEEDGFKNYPRVDVCAYAVMSKKIQKVKVKTCTDCGHIGLGSHKTCDNVVNGSRCNGAWGIVTTLVGNTQFIVDKVSEEFGLTVLENASTIVSCVEKGIFPKNFNKCQDNYGAPCEFLHLCHKNDKTGLFKVVEKVATSG